MDPYDFIYARYEFDSALNRTSDNMIHLYKKWPRLNLSAEEVRRLGSLGIEYQAGGITRRIDPLESDTNPMYANIPPNHSIDGGSVFEMSSLVSGSNPMNGSVNGDAEEGGDAGMPLMSKQEEARIFRGVDRLKLITMIITSTGPGGCGLDVRKLLKHRAILAYMPLHDMVELRALEAQWLTFFDMPWNQPVDQIKDYFGEKIGLYFKWLGMYTSWLVVAAVLGFGFWINVAVDQNDPNTKSVPYFAGLMAMWSVVFLEHWKRTEKNTALKWGMIGFEENEVTRPQFEGERILSPVNGKPVLYYPREKRARQEFVSSAVIYAFILVVIAVIASIFALRIAIHATKATLAGVELSSVVASVLLALQIQVLNGYFSDVAIKLTNKENHRTDTEYEDALIAKTFSFQFVNSYASLFYIAFIKPFIPSIDPCTDLNCLGELQTTLGTIFLMRVTIGNVTELGVPLMQTFLANRQRAKAQEQRAHQSSTIDPRNTPYSEDGMNLNETVSREQLEAMEAKSELSEVETAFMQPCYDVMLGTFEDYAEMAIQFGYTTMFVAAFPLATVLSMVNNYVGK